MLPHYAVKPIPLQDVFISTISGDRLLISHVFNTPVTSGAWNSIPPLQPLCTAACHLRNKHMSAISSETSASRGDLLAATWGSSARDMTIPEQEGLCLMLQWGFNPSFSTIHFLAGDPSPKGTPLNSAPSLLPLWGGCREALLPLRALSGLEQPPDPSLSKAAISLTQGRIPPANTGQKKFSKGQMQRLTLKQVQMQQKKIKPKIHSATSL